MRFTKKEDLKRIQLDIEKRLNRILGPGGGGLTAHHTQHERGGSDVVDLTKLNGQYTYIQEVGGELFLSFNAMWDGTNWVRIDTAKQAYTINMRRSNIPGEGVSGW